MKKLSSLIAFLLVLTGTALYAANVDISGDLRYRAELRTNLNDGGDTYSDGADSEFDQTSRARINFDSGKAHAQVLAYQDADASSTDTFLLEELYMDVDVADAVVRVGRFGLEYGEGRIVSHSDWENDPTTFDGIGFYRQIGEVVLQGVITNTDGDSVADDFFLSGLYAEYDNEYVNVDGYFVQANYSGEDDDTLNTFGVLLDREVMPGFKLSLEYALQSGNQGNASVDYEGTLLAIAGSYAFDDMRNTSVFFDFAQVSGDDSSTSDKNEGWVDFAGDTHRYGGAMDLTNVDYFSNLNTITLGVMSELTTDISGRAAFSIFTTNETTGDDEVGSELDFSVNTNYDGLDVQAGLSFFLPGDATASDGDNAMWLYVQGTAAL